jgi:class 3 adenylate cyclase
LAADVVGYSKAMAEDEAGTLARLKAHRAELFGTRRARSRA